MDKSAFLLPSYFYFLFIITVITVTAKIICVQYLPIKKTKIEVSIISILAETGAQVFSCSVT